jgi:hypothetical protein
VSSKKREFRVGRNWYHWFVYASLLFVAVALYRFDYLALPRFVSHGTLLVSVILLIAGFLCTAAGWGQALAKAGYPVRFGEALAALGLSIFGNYMPGKVWLIVGRAGYVARRRGYPLGKLTVASLNAQLISLWTGLVVGAVGLLLLDGFRLWGPLVLAMFIALSLVIFSGVVHRFMERILGAILRRPLVIPLLELRQTWQVMPWFILGWLVWALAFALFVDSASTREMVLLDGLGFPLATTIGILAIFSPGGLGAREAVLAGYLVLAGATGTEAATVAVAARLWYLLGEVALFAVGWLMHRSLADG